MEVVNGSYFKLVYSDWYIKGGDRMPFGNMIHPKIRELAQDFFKKDLKLDWRELLEKENQDNKPIKFDHSELLNYFDRNFPKNIVSLNQILDDDSIYIYPVEIRTTLSPLNDINEFNFDGIKYEWQFEDLISDELLNHFRTGKIKILKRMETLNNFFFLNNIKILHNHLYGIIFYLIMDLI
jgi:hypothetical protein